MCGNLKLNWRSKKAIFARFSALKVFDGLQSSAEPSTALAFGRHQRGEREREDAHDTTSHCESNFYCIPVHVAWFGMLWPVERVFKGVLLLSI